MTQPTGVKKVRVLIVDDSAVVQRWLSRILSEDPEIEVCGVAMDPYDAREKLVQLRPDVMTLDVDMPRMDGLSFLEKVMQHFPTRTIVFSNMVGKDPNIMINAKKFGAVDVVKKPEVKIADSYQALSADLIARIKKAARSELTKAA